MAEDQESLDALSHTVQSHLSQNRTDLALATAETARSLHGDIPQVNLMESWIGLREGGPNYQRAFYVFEELAQAPPSDSSSDADRANYLTAQAVSELHLHRWQEAETALRQALEVKGDNGNAMADLVVLQTILGRREEAVKTKERLAGMGHTLLEDLDRKRQAFSAAAAKYKPKFEP
ncbi:hypothetical protein LTR66_009528 [Elasticomyces elasticus]|nr:hypothetical protein LTR66_009528 [Elasticomyces elasticus]